MPTEWVPSSPDTVADGLGAWIAALGDRLGRGEFSHLGPVTLSDGKQLGAELAVRLALNDIDHYKHLPRSWGNDVLKVVRRRLLLYDLQDLRQQLG